MRIRITRIDRELPLPVYHTSGAVAFDLYSRKSIAIPPKEVAVLPSNFIIEVPQGHVLLVASRSSTPGKKGLMIANGMGVIDQDFHGPDDELGILVYNFRNTPMVVERGERIAQALIVPIERVEFEEITVTETKSRGGFGTTN